MKRLWHDKRMPVGLLETCRNDAAQRWGIDPMKIRDLEVYCFPQVWGSTSLGFGGIGGASMTTATTIIIHSWDKNIAGVYFAGGHAYDISDPGTQFWDAMNKRQMPAVSKQATLREIKADV
jgi:hypothetical protein